MLAFLKVRVDAGRRGSPNDWSSLAGLLIVNPPPPPRCSFSTRAYVLSPRQCLQCSIQACLVQGQGSWGPTGDGACWVGRLFCMNQHVRCRVPWDNSYGDKLRKIFVTFGAESDSSLLTVSLGKHPSNEQQAPAPSLFSPGMANALQ